MVHDRTTANISDDSIRERLGQQLSSLLGIEIADPNLGALQTQIQLFTIAPGTTFWHSGSDALNDCLSQQAGIYIILTGKVRLFDLQDERIATLTVGQSFGESTLFPDADFDRYIAKSPLVVSGKDIQVGFIPKGFVSIYQLLPIGTE